MNATGRVEHCLERLELIHADSNPTYSRIYARLPKEFAKDKNRRVKDKLLHAEPIEPVVEIVTRFRHQLPMAVVSGGTRVNVHITLESIGLKDFFDRTYYPTQEKVTGRPCIAFVTHGGGGKALESVEVMCKKFKFKMISESIMVKGRPDSEAETQLMEAGRKLAAAAKV